ncbi:MAG: HD domain-containing protein [Leptospirales bacterium]
MMQIQYNTLRKHLCDLQQWELEQEWDILKKIEMASGQTEIGSNLFFTQAGKLTILISKENALWTELNLPVSEQTLHVSSFVNENESSNIPETFHEVKIVPVNQTREFNIKATDNSIQLLENYEAEDILEAARLVSRYLFLQYETIKPKDILPEFLSIAYGRRKYYFEQILLGRKPSRAFHFFEHCEVHNVFFPEIFIGKGLSQNRFHIYDIYDHLINACDGVEQPDFILRAAALLHDIGKVPTRKVKPSGEASFYNHEIVSANICVPILKRFGVPKEIGLRIKFLIRNHMFHYTNEWTDRAVRRFLRKVSNEELMDLIELRKADRIGSGKKNPFPKGLEKLISHIEEVIALDKEMKVTDLQVGGADLIELGLSEGPKIGIVLKTILDEVKDELYENEYETLLQRAKEILESENAGNLK